MSVFVGGDWIGDEDGDALDEIFANNIVGLYSKDSDSNTWNKIDDDIAFEKAIIKVGQASEGDWLGS